MSLYNMLFGVHPIADELLAILKLTRDEVGRFRDCYLVAKDKIALHTRNGGGNRDDYQWVFDSLKKHPNYLYDRDDDFDCTYADIYFSVPEASKELCELLFEEYKTPEAKDKWIALLKALKSGEKTPETERALMVGKGIFDAIYQPLKKAVVKNETGQVSVEKIDEKENRL